MGKTYKLKNVVYSKNFNIVGGIETYCYEMALKYGKDFDITILYESAPQELIQHWRSLCRVIRFRPGDIIECDVFIFGYWSEILDSINAKEYIQVYHADYAVQKLSIDDDKRITKRFGVSDNTTNGIRKTFPFAQDCVTMYNPYTVKKPKKVLNLVSACRLSPEKGFDRMVKLADALDRAEIPFHWSIYTDQDRQFPNKSVAVMKARRDVLDFIADADYFVQLSDTEGMSYSITEALSVGTPVIITAIPVAAEQGVEDGKNGFILPFDMADIPVEAIYKGLKKFKYEPKESHYETVLSPGESEYSKIPEKKHHVRVLSLYYDIPLGREVAPGTELEVSEQRADLLIDKGLALWID